MDVNNNTYHGLPQGLMKDNGDLGIDRIWEELTR